MRGEFEFTQLDMNFNYQQIPFGFVKDKVMNSHITATTKVLLDNAIPDVDKSLADVNKRLFEKDSRFNENIVWDNDICNTLHNHGMYRGNDKVALQTMDYIHCQTFPEDYNAGDTNIVYLIGMSVPPVMIKRIVNRLLQTDIFKKGA